MKKSISMLLSLLIVITSIFAVGVVSVNAAVVTGDRVSKIDSTVAGGYLYRDTYAGIPGWKIEGATHSFEWQNNEVADMQGALKLTIGNTTKTPDNFNYSWGPGTISQITAAAVTIKDPNNYGILEYTANFSEDNMATILKSGKSPNYFAAGIGTSETSKANLYQRVEKNTTHKVIIQYPRVYDPKDTVDDKIKMWVDGKLVGEYDNGGDMNIGNMSFSIYNANADEKVVYIKDWEITATTSGYRLPGNDIISISNSNVSYDNSNYTITVNDSELTGNELLSAITVPTDSSKNISNTGKLSTNDEVVVSSENAADCTYKVLVYDPDVEIGWVDSTVANGELHRTDGNMVPTWKIEAKNGVPQDYTFIWQNNDISDMKGSMKLTLGQTADITTDNYPYGWHAGIWTQTSNPKLYGGDAVKDYNLLEFTINFSADNMAAIFKSFDTSDASNKKYFSAGIGTVSSKNANMYYIAKKDTTYKVAIQYPRDNAVGKEINMWVNGKLVATHINDGAMLLANTNFAFINTNAESKNIYVKDWKVTATNNIYSAQTSGIIASSLKLETNIAKATLSNRDASAGNCVMIVAQYTDDGKMLTDYEYVYIDVPANSENLVFRSKNTFAGNVRAFIFNNLINIKPLIMSVSTK